MGSRNRHLRKETYNLSDTTHIPFCNTQGTLHNFYVPVQEKNQIKQLTYVHNIRLLYIRKNIEKSVCKLNLVENKY